MGEPNANKDGDAPPARPENIPEKFWDAKTGTVRAEDMAKAYGELEKKLHAPPPADGKTAGGGLRIEAPDPGELSDDATVDQVLQSVGLDPEKITEHFIKHKELKPSDYAALRKKGFTKGVVDQFLATQVKLARHIDTALRAEAITRVGGEEKLNNLLAWARTGLKEDERVAYNHLLGNENAGMAWLDYLIGKHKDAVGAGDTKPLIEGGGVGSPGTAFANRREVTAAMQDPRYSPNSPKHDPSYYRSVQQRLAATESVTALR